MSRKQFQDAAENAYLSAYWENWDRVRSNTLNKYLCSAANYKYMSSFSNKIGLSMKQNWPITAHVSSNKRYMILWAINQAHKGHYTHTYQTKTGGFNILTDEVSFSNLDEILDQQEDMAIANPIPSNYLNALGNNLTIKNEVYLSKPFRFNKGNGKPAVLVSINQRRDAGGEGFVSCVDIIVDGGEDSNPDTPDPPKPPTPQPPATSSKHVSGYIDVGLSSFDLPYVKNYVESTGIKSLRLAFASDGIAKKCDAKWAIVYEMNHAPLSRAVEYLKSKNIEIVCVTGGANSQFYLERLCPNANALYAQYQKIVRAGKCTKLEVDVEASINTPMTADALEMLKKNDKIEIALTLLGAGSQIGYDPQLSSGILYSLANKNIFPEVNIMVFNYALIGDWENYEDSVGFLMDKAAEELEHLYDYKHNLVEIKSKYLNPVLMIGANDYPRGRFTTQDQAEKIQKWMESNGYGASSIRFWSVARDNGDCASTPPTISPECSGITQGKFEFSKIFIHNAGNETETPGENQWSVWLVFYFFVKIF